MLLIFSFGYAIWRELTKNRPSSQNSEYSPPSYLGIALFILGLALVSYLVRIVIPLGRTVFQFPTLAYQPQYLSFFIVGSIAYRRDWFRKITANNPCMIQSTMFIVNNLLIDLILADLGVGVRNVDRVVGKVLCAVNNIKVVHFLKCIVICIMFSSSYKRIASLNDLRGGYSFKNCTKQH